MPHYIQRKGNGHRETVDQFDTRKEARDMIPEYRMADPTAEYWIDDYPLPGWEDPK